MYQIDLAIARRLVMQHPERDKIAVAISEMSTLWDLHPATMFGRCKDITQGLLRMDSEVDHYAACPEFLALDNDRIDEAATLMSVAYWTYYTHDPTVFRGAAQAFNAQWNIPVFYAQRQVEAQIIGVLTPYQLIEGGKLDGS